MFYFSPSFDSRFLQRSLLTVLSYGGSGIVDVSEQYIASVLRIEPSKKQAESRRSYEISVSFCQVTRRPLPEDNINLSCSCFSPQCFSKMSCSLPGLCFSLR
jgi:hypothetical protein